MKTPSAPRVRPPVPFTLLLLTPLLMQTAGPSGVLRAGESNGPPAKAVVAPPIPAAPRAGMVQVNLYVNDAEVRRQLLESTPKGTDFDTVAEFLNRRLQRTEFPLGAGPVRSSTYADPGAAVGSERLRKRLTVFLGFRHRSIETSTRLAVTAFYAFDDQDRLSDIFLVKAEEHL